MVYITQEQVYNASNGDINASDGLANGLGMAYASYPGDVCEEPRRSSLRRVRRSSPHGI